MSAQKSERSRQVLIEEAKIQKKFSPGEGKGDPDFYENLKKWQVKKERNLALGKEKKEEEELKEVKSGPELNEKSMKIVKKLREIQGCSTLSLNRLAIVKRKSALTPPPSFVPAMSEKSKILALNRSGSVFDRLYSYKTPKKVEKSQSPIRKKSKSPSVIGLNRSYSINSGRGIISDKISLVDQIKYEEHMKFLIASLG